MYIEGIKMLALVNDSPQQENLHVTRENLTYNKICHIIRVVEVECFLMKPQIYIYKRNYHGNFWMSCEL